MVGVRSIALALWALWGIQGGGTFSSDAAIPCELCATWNRDREPFKVFGNTYYVGVDGLSAVLIASEGGLILLDGALPQSAALIDGHIRRLGFRTEDIRLIVNSHAHFDHAGGIAALQRASGATVAASPAGARALRQGRPAADDPQSESPRFPPVTSVRVVRDGERLKVGAQEITARFTPGHTPGGTTWTWRSCEGARCLNIVYADSLNAVSDPGFRFTGDGRRRGIVDTFRKSIRLVEQLPCDILISVHPGFSDLFRNLESRDRGAADVFFNAKACRVYAENALQTLNRRVAEEQRSPDVK